jgi:hypothetical protein
MVKPLIACVLVFFSCGSADTKSGSNVTRTQVIARTLHLDSPKKGESRYQYVPFEVSPYTHQISVSYNYDHAGGSNALDIGLFDSRASERAGDVAGFRGWSGGRRAEFFVARETATPGYVPGDIPPGTWRIILGLYRVIPAGVDVTLKIVEEMNESKTTNLAAPAAKSQTSMGMPGSLTNRLAIPEPVALAEQKVFPRWVSGDLHLHTVHSDGDWTIPELMTTARNARLDFIFITDHNTYSHHAEIDRLSGIRNDLLVMRGEEITTYGGHTNAWGLPKNVLIDFRVQPGDLEGISRIASQAHRRGALISINHPFAPCPGCNWSYGQEAVGFDAVEVWNGLWDTSDELALVLWDRLLQKGRHITAVASSDSHRPANPVGQAATHVAIDSPLTEAAVLKSIRAGRVYLTSTATSPRITLEAQGVSDRHTHGIGEVIRLNNSRRLRFKIVTGELSRPATISLISQGKIILTLPTETEGKPQYVEVDSDSSAYFRLEVRDLNGAMLALTNPIYVESKNSCVSTR